AQFWQDVMHMRPEAAQHTYLQTTLYLALATHTFMRRRRLPGLETAVRYGLSIHAIPYWGQFFYSILNYAIRRIACFLQNACKKRYEP
ncbi:MAG: hypothetical protein GY943_08630, partial [Chloroflexi bacterium]|nr:hypothetical protein [Chloroflexota bacterium]